MKRLWNFIKENVLLLTVTAVMLAIGGYYLWRHWQPFTQNAFVVANTRPVSVLVEGYITEVHVVNNQFVKKGAPLFTVFQPPYALKVETLQHKIDATKAKLASLEAKLKVINASIVAREAALANDRYLSEKADEMYRQEAISQAYAEERRRAMQGSEAELAAEKYQLDVTTQECEMTRAEISQLQSELALAQIYLEQTVVYALSDGYIVNMFVTPGGYFHPGEPLCAFVDTESWWVQANFEETDLSRIQPGQTAKIWLWQYPGKTFHGVVDNINWAAERRRSADTGVAIVEKENQWFLLPQRFPVQIRITDPDPEFPLHPAGSAYVEIDTDAQLIKQIFWRIFQW